MVSDGCGYTGFVRFGPSNSPMVLVIVPALARSGAARNKARDGSMLATLREQDWVSDILKSFRNKGLIVTSSNGHGLDRHSLAVLNDVGTPPMLARCH